MKSLFIGLFLLINLSVFAQLQDSLTGQNLLQKWDMTMWTLL